MLLPVLTKAINAYLKLDQASNQRLKKLNGKAITIEFLPFHFIFQCVFNDNSVSLLHTDELLQTETTIRGTPLQMLGVAMTKDERHRFFAEDLQIEGDAEIGQQVIELFDELQIDWEDRLAKFIGDVPAYHVGQVFDNVQAWLSMTQKTFIQNINEYIHEEAQFLPQREALQDFFSEIDILRMDVDRIDARLARLRAYLEEPKEDEANP